MSRRRTIGSPPRLFDSLFIVGRLSEGAGHLCESARKLALSHTMGASISTRGHTCDRHSLSPRENLRAVTFETFLQPCYRWMNGAPCPSLRTCVSRKREGISAQQVGTRGSCSSCRLSMACGRLQSTTSAPRRGDTCRGYRLCWADELSCVL